MKQYVCNHCLVKDCRLFRRTRISDDVLCVSCLIKFEQPQLTVDSIVSCLDKSKLLLYLDQISNLTTLIKNNRVPAIHSDEYLYNMSGPVIWKSLCNFSLEDWEHWLSLPWEQPIMFPRILELT